MVTPPTEKPHLTEWSYIQESRNWRVGLALPLAVATAAVSIATMLLLPVPSGTAVAGSLLIGLASLVATRSGPTETRLWAVAVCLIFGVGAAVGDTPQPLAIWLIFVVFVLGQTELIGRSSRRLRLAATTDPLTGLNNWNGLNGQLASLIPTCRRLGTPITVAVMDLDDFKELNDREGHAAGDRTLIECAQIWRSQVRAEDVLARVGGDEFLLVLPGTIPDEAIGTIERLKRKSPISWCYGTAQLNPGEDLHTCLARADADLYRSKASRREHRSTAVEVDARQRSVPGGTG